MADKTVVAISSFVMRGAVGLRATQFALERRGVRVIAVPTVVMPWHPGLGPSTRSQPQEFETQLRELEAIAGEVDAVITGYFAAEGQVAAAADFIGAVRAAGSKALVVVDPVSGDERGRYVPDAVADAILSRLLPRADVATPNANELRDLTGCDDLATAARALGPPAVVATSAISSAGSVGAVLFEGSDTTSVEHEAIANAPRGTGDLFLGVFVAACLAGASYRHALREAAAATLGVVKLSDPEALALAGAQDVIASPPLAPVTMRTGPTPRRA